MKKVYNTAVVIIPPEDIWNPIQKIRKRYDRNIDRWMPHITMLYPFYPRSEFSSILKKFVKISGKVNSFKVQLEEIKYFQHKKENYTIWLKPEKSQEIIKLQKLLLSQAPNCDEVNKFKLGFTPHLSLGQIKGKANLNSVLKELEQIWNPIVFIVQDIAFIWRNNENPRDPFKIIEKISF